MLGQHESTWGAGRLLAATFEARRTALGCGTSRSMLQGWRLQVGALLRSSSGQGEVMAPRLEPRSAARASKVWLGDGVREAVRGAVLTSGALLLDQGLT